MKFDILDKPNHRSSHVKPTALMGGVGFVSAFLMSAGGLYLSGSSVSIQWMGAGVGMLILAFFGWLDDCRGLSAKLRFSVQLLVGSLVYFSGFQLQNINLYFFELFFSPVVAWGVTVLMIVSLINIVNFMDGMDGYVSSICILGFLFNAYLAWMGNQGTVWVLLLIMVAALLGFLVFNFPKASIFMGDVGSTVLGLFIAVIWLDISSHTGISNIFWIELMIWGIFIFDAGITLLKRIIRKEYFFEAHREHYYQLLMRSGWTHLQVLVFELILMMIVLIILGVSVSLDIQWLIGGALIMLIGKYFVLEYWIRRQNVFLSD